MFRYRIPGYYIPGVPARDLSTEEYMELEPWQRKAVAESDIYEQAGHTKKPSKVAVKEK